MFLDFEIPRTPCGRARLLTISALHIISIEECSPSDQTKLTTTDGYTYIVSGTFAEVRAKLRGATQHG